MWKKKYEVFRKDLKRQERWVLAYKTSKGWRIVLEQPTLSKLFEEASDIREAIFKECFKEHKRSADDMPLVAVHE